MPHEPRQLYRQEHELGEPFLLVISVSGQRARSVGPWNGQQKKKAAGSCPLPHGDVWI